MQLKLLCQNCHMLAMNDMCKKGLSPYEAEILVDDLELAAYYEQAYALAPSKHMVNWILRDVMGYLKENKLSLSELKMTPEKLAALVSLVDKGIINNRAAQEVFALVCQTGQAPEAIVKEKGLEQIGSSDELEAIVKELLAANLRHKLPIIKQAKKKCLAFLSGK